MGVGRSVWRRRIVACALLGAIGYVVPAAALLPSARRDCESPDLANNGMTTSFVPLRVTCVLIDSDLRRSIRVEPYRSHPAAAPLMLIGGPLAGVGVGLILTRRTPRVAPAAA